MHPKLKIALFGVSYVFVIVGGPVIKSIGFTMANFLKQP